MTKKTVTIRVPEHLYKIIEALLPIYGTKTAVIIQALCEFKKTSRFQQDMKRVRYEVLQVQKEYEEVSGKTGRNIVLESEGTGSDIISPTRPTNQKEIVMRADTQIKLDKLKEYLQALKESRNAKQVQLTRKALKEVIFDVLGVRDNHTINGWIVFLEGQYVVKCVSEVKTNPTSTTRYLIL